jgi:pyrrolidone-carboxylate peptidase
VRAQTGRFETAVTVVGRAGLAGAPSEHLVTFSGPVQVPGVSLAAGAYIFRFVTPSVVQVLSGDRSEVYAMFMAVPALRRDVTADFAVKLAYNRFDAPVRVGKLFAAGSSAGVEFLYPPLRPMFDYIAPLPEVITRR